MPQMRSGISAYGREENLIGRLVDLYTDDLLLLSALLDRPLDEAGV